MEIKLVEQPTGSEDLVQTDNYLQQFHESLHLNIDLDNEKNCNALFDPVLPLGNGNTDVDDGKEGDGGMISI